MIKEFERLDYEGYVRKRPKNEPTDSYSYLARQFSKCMMIINSHVGPVRIQTTNTQKMNISDMNTQKIPNLHVCSSDESEPKRINLDKTVSYLCSTDKSESKSVTVNASSMDESESKRAYISVNTSEVKYTMDKKKDGENLVTDNPVINV